MAQEELMKKEDDLSDMKKTLNKLEEKLLNGKFVDEIYDIGKDRGKIADHDRTVEKEIAIKLSEIKELDMIINLKSEEIKRVKRERMRTIEETTNLLVVENQQNSSGAIKNNMEQFLRLLKSEASDYSSENLDEPKSTKTKDKLRVDDKSKKPNTFIERNIQLAKCGDGILSLTDEEKQRLKIVLSDIEGVDSELNVSANADTKTMLEENHYALQEDARKTLELIDKELEEHEKTKFPLNSIRSSILKLEDQSESEKEDVKKIKSKIQTKKLNDRKRLKEVDKLLNTISSATYEELDPLLDEDLQYILEESKQILSLTSRSENGNIQTSPNFATAECDLEMPSKETIMTLVAAAKNSMPNFKFRYE